MMNMASNFGRAGSERLPHQPSGTVMSKEEIKRRLSENSLKWTPGIKDEEEPKEDYALPNKAKFQEAIAARNASSGKRQVTFKENTTAGDRETLVRTTTRHTTTKKITPMTNDEERPSVSDTEENPGPLQADVGLYEDDSGEVRGVLELSTLHQQHVPRIKVRVVCLIDVSGSMLLKGDKRKQRSKIAILKNMAVDMIDALDDDEDFIGVMTFGMEPRVVCPLTLVSAQSRNHVKKTISKLDENTNFAANTDLSSAIKKSVQMLTSEQQNESLLYRNCIIVFSDGEVNAGITDPKELVHDLREEIRKCGMPRDILADLWVNVSCVTTGSNFSESLYLVSKLCGSDAYFFVDGEKTHPEAEMLIPLMLRKTACAQMVSVTVRAANGATLATGKCSQEYSVRRRGTADTPKDSMAYFLHDLPVGSRKTFTLALDVGGVRISLGKDFLFVDVQYVDPVGVLHTVSKSLGLQQVVSLKEQKEKCLEIIHKRGIGQLRELLQATCRNVAQFLKDAKDDADNDRDDDTPIWAVNEGKKELQELRKEFSAKLQGHPLEDNFEQFADAVADNLEKLKKIVHQNRNNRGKSWQYAKAMSSAVIRELPTVSDVLAQPRVVCPLPEAQGCESKRTQALSLYIFGGDEEAGGMYADRATLLHNAASDVAKSLADVLKMLDPDTGDTAGETP